MLDPEEVFHRAWCERWSIPRNKDHPAWLAQGKTQAAIEWYEEQILAHRDEHPDLLIENIEYRDIWPEQSPETFDGILAEVQRKYPQLDLHDAVEQARTILQRRVESSHD